MNVCLSLKDLLMMSADTLINFIVINKKQSPQGNHDNANTNGMSDSSTGNGFAIKFGDVNRHDCRNLSTRPKSYRYAKNSYQIRARADGLLRLFSRPKS